MTTSWKYFFPTLRGFDQSLQTGPYNSGFVQISEEGEVSNIFDLERCPYQDGLLVSYWDTSWSDNTGTHPGEGLILPIDAHPDAMVRADGGIWRNRVQSFDSPFSLDGTDPITLHWFGEPFYHPSQPAVPVFDDRKQYWNAATPTAGVVNPNTGTQIRIKSISARDGFMQVEVRPAK